MNPLLKTRITQLAFLFLFAAEFTFYLLILQTGVVEYHHSALAEIWMVPAGGMAGILVSIFYYRERGWLIPFLLFLQLLLSFQYAVANPAELFLFGLISGLTAPMLIARIDRFGVVVVALALSYMYGTSYFDVPAVQRTDIALFLSAVALFASFFANMAQRREARGSISYYSAGSIFLWLLLDAALFETLSRDSVMHLWGSSAFTWNIVLFHCIGLAAAYKLKDWRYNDGVLLALFMLTYLLYASGSREMLSLVYPFVISYYNVIILRRLIRLPYRMLAVMALSLWAASGMGLLIALSHTFVPAWVVLLMLAGIYLYRSFQPQLYRVLYLLGLTSTQRSLP